MLKFVFNWAPKVNEIVGNSKGLRSANFRTTNKNVHLEWCLVFYAGGLKSQAGQTQILGSTFSLGASTFSLTSSRHSSISVYLTGAWPVDNVRAAISLSVVTCPGKPTLFCNSDAREYAVKTGWTAGDFVPSCIGGIPDSILVTADKRILITCIVSIDESRLNAVSPSIEINGTDVGLNNEERILFESVMTGQKTGKNDWDVSLSTNDGNQFYGHRSILSEKSSYFRYLFSKNPDSKSVHLDADDETLVEVLYYVYTNKFGENLKNVALKCYKMAGFLELYELQKRSEQAALYSVNADNCIQCLLFTENFPELTKLRLISLSIIAENYSALKRTQQWKTICNYSHLLEAILDKVCSTVTIGVKCTGDCIREKC